MAVMPVATLNRALFRAIWLATFLLMLIGVAIVIRRAAVLIAPPPAPRNSITAGLDANFARHPALTMAHILPGLAFVLLAPLQFSATLRRRRPRLHRWTGRIVIAAGLMIGVTALVMGPQMAIGGPNETAATMLFASLFLFALIRAYICIRRRDFALHREWMIRAFAIGMAVATIRPIMGVFFATAKLSHLTPHDFFGTAFWLGFTIQLIAAEAWINYTRARSRPAMPLRHADVRRTSAARR